MSKRERSTLRFQNAGKISKSQSAILKSQKRIFFFFFQFWGFGKISKIAPFEIADHQKARFGSGTSEAKFQNAGLLWNEWMSEEKGKKIKRGGRRE